MEAASESAFKWVTQTSLQIVKVSGTPPGSLGVFELEL